MSKEIRIKGSTGYVVDADRTIHTTKAKSNGGPDGVRWKIVGKGGPFTIHFVHSPFDSAAGAQDISVSKITGASFTRTVAAPVDDYKYSVFDSKGNETDDPNVIIDS